MALQKRLISPAGGYVSYWVITDIELSRERKQVKIVLSAYTSKSAYERGYAPLREMRRQISVADVDYTDTEYENRTRLHYTEYFSPSALADKDLYAVAYQYIKQHIDDFKNAEDV